MEQRNQPPSPYDEHAPENRQRETWWIYLNSFHVGKTKYLHSRALKIMILRSSLKGVHYNIMVSPPMVVME